MLNETSLTSMSSVAYSLNYDSRSQLFRSMKKDMIKTGGENVSSRKVEEVLYSLPSESEAAVVGLPDPRWIKAVTAVTAVIVRRSGCVIGEADIIAYCRERLSAFKVPKRIIFLPTVCHEIPVARY